MLIVAMLASLRGDGRQPHGADWEEGRQPYGAGLVGTGLGCQPLTADPQFHLRPPTQETKTARGSREHGVNIFRAVLFGASQGGHIQSAAPYGQVPGLSSEKMSV